MKVGPWDFHFAVARRLGHWGLFTWIRWTKRPNNPPVFCGATIGPFTLWWGLDTPFPREAK